MTPWNGYLYYNQYINMIPYLFILLYIRKVNISNLKFYNPNKDYIILNILVYPERVYNYHYINDIFTLCSL